MKEKLKSLLLKVAKFLFNPRFLLCFGIGWMITNGWSYLLLGLGIHLKIGWMVAVSSTYLAWLWLPVSPEKIVTLAIAAEGAVSQGSKHPGGAAGPLPKGQNRPQIPQALRLPLPRGSIPSSDAPPPEAPLFKGELSAQLTEGINSQQQCLPPEAPLFKGELSRLCRD